MEIKNMIVKDIIFSPTEREKAGKHITRLLENGWDEFAGFVDETGLAQGEVHTDDKISDLELVQVHKVIVKLR